jgi:hypothetical protein
MERKVIGMVIAPQTFRACNVRACASELLMTLGQKNSHVVEMARYLSARLAAVRPVRPVRLCALDVIQCHVPVVPRVWPGWVRAERAGVQHRQR